MVFAVQDLILFFLSWELELVPVYLMLAIYGGKKRQYAATKFIIYTAGSSLFILLAGLAMGFWAGGPPNFEYTYLAQQGFPKNFQLWCYVAFLISFGVKLPIVPLHTWLLMHMVKQLHQSTCCLQVFFSRWVDMHFCDSTVNFSLKHMQSLHLC